MYFWERFENLSQNNYIPGRVLVNQEGCTGCRNCNNVCPAKALETIDRKTRMIPGADCISCGACVAVCKDKQIRIIGFWNVPDGAYKTTGRLQTTTADSYPRDFR